MSRCGLDWEIHPDMDLDSFYSTETPIWSPAPPRDVRSLNPPSSDVSLFAPKMAVAECSKEFRDVVRHIVE
jgi:hypothetical protein